MVEDLLCVTSGQMKTSPCSRLTAVPHSLIKSFFFFLAGLWTEGNQKWLSESLMQEVSFRVKSNANDLYNWNVKLNMLQRTGLWLLEEVISLIPSPANPFSFPHSLGGYANNWGLGAVGGATSGNQPDFSLCLSGAVWFVMIHALLFLFKETCRMELLIKKRKPPSPVHPVLVQLIKDFLVYDMKMFK